MSFDLVKHMVKKWHARVNVALTGTVKVDRHGDLGFGGISCDGGDTRWASGHGFPLQLKITIFYVQHLFHVV